MSDLAGLLDQPDAVYRSKNIFAAGLVGHRGTISWGGIKCVTHVCIANEEHVIVLTRITRHVTGTVTGRSDHLP